MPKILPIKKPRGGKAPLAPGQHRREWIRRHQPLRSRSAGAEERARQEQRAAARYERNYGDYAALIRLLPCCVRQAAFYELMGLAVRVEEHLASLQDRPRSFWPDVDPHHAVTRGAGGDKSVLVPLSPDLHQALDSPFSSSATLLREKGGLPWDHFHTVAARLWSLYGDVNVPELLARHGLHVREEVGCG